MNCFNKYKINIFSEDMPKVRRNCPKCGKQMFFINTKRFRVNANKNNIDVWLIYQCEKCKESWNMTILERVNPKDINQRLYKRFLENDEDLVKHYAFDVNMYNKNKAEVIWGKVKYKFYKETVEQNINNNESIISINMKIPLNIRIDKLLSDIFGISRSKIKLMMKEGNIVAEHRDISLKNRINDGLIVHIKHKL